MVNLKPIKVKDFGTIFDLSGVKHCSLLLVPKQEADCIEADLIISSLNQEIKHSVQVELMGEVPESWLDSEDLFINIGIKELYLEYLPQSSLFIEIGKEGSTPDCDVLLTLSPEKDPPTLALFLGLLAYRPE